MSSMDLFTQSHLKRPMAIIIAILITILGSEVTSSDVIVSGTEAATVRSESAVSSITFAKSMIIPVDFDYLLPSHLRLLRYLNHNDNNKRRRRNEEQETEEEESEESEPEDPDFANSGGDLGIGGVIFCCAVGGTMYWAVKRSREREAAVARKKAEEEAAQQQAQQQQAQSSQQQANLNSVVGRPSAVTASPLTMMQQPDGTFVYVQTPTAQPGFAQPYVASMVPVGPQQGYQSPPMYQQNVQVQQYPSYWTSSPPPYNLDPMNPMMGGQQRRGSNSHVEVVPEENPEVLEKIKKMMKDTWRVKYTRDRVRPGSKNSQQVPTSCQVLNVLRVENHDAYSKLELAKNLIKQTRGNQMGTTDRISGYQQFSNPVQTFPVKTGMKAKAKKKKNTSAITSSSGSDSDDSFSDSDDDESEKQAKLLLSLDPNSLQSHNNLQSSSLNEVYLFHGTNPESADMIARGDFLISKAGSSCGTMFGPGLYLAENSSKSDEYAQEGKGVFKGQYAMLICRTVLGRVCVVEQPGDYSKKVLGNFNFNNLNFGGNTNFVPPIGSGEYDSICGDRKKAVGTFREFITFHEAAVCAEYIVLYKREYITVD